MDELTFQVEVKDQHRITIPKATRELLNISIDDIVMVTIRKGNTT